jgi:ABC-type uncharacterized transport system auxiliary subunit
MKTITIFFGLIILGFAGCISIKSDYPDIKFYRLNQEKTILKTNDTISGTLQVRDFTTRDDLETVHLLTLWGDNQVQKYFYHRWSTDCGPLVTDFILQRFNQMETFRGGVVKSTSILIPEYFLEGQILDFIAYSGEKELGSSYISISIQVSLSGREAHAAENQLLFNKVYSLKIPRNSNKVESIPPAMSIGISKISDLILNDIISAIKSNKLSN